MTAITMNDPIMLRYCRKSTKGDASIELQATTTLGFGEANGYEDGGVFKDSDESGNRDTRLGQGKEEIPPALKDLMKAVAAIKESTPTRTVVIVAWKEDRLMRDVTTKEELRRFLKQWRGAYWQGMDTGLRDPRNPNDTLVSSVTTAANQHMADQTREKVLDKQDARLALGQPFGRPPFGHRYNDDHTRWEVVDHEADVLRRMISDHLAGTPLMTIAARLNAEGVKSRGGAAWSGSNLRKLLVQPRLAGELFYRGESHGVTPNIDPIIDEATLRRITALIERRRYGKRRTPKALLAGVLTCGRCGSRLGSKVVGQAAGAPRNGGKYVRQTSNEVRTYGCCAAGGCYGAHVNAAAADAVVTKALFDALKAGAPTTTRGNQGLRKLDEELAFLDEEEAELAEGADDMPVTVLRRKGAALKERRAALEARREALFEVADSGRWYSQARRIIKSWDTDLTLDEQRKIILDVLGQFAVTPGGRGLPATPERVAARLRPLRVQ